MTKLVQDRPATVRAGVMRYVFVISFTILFALFFTGLVKDYTGTQVNVFFLKTEDYMADYYNVAKVSNGFDPYLYGQNKTNAERAYFPFTYVLFAPLSKLANYANLSAFDAGRSSVGLATSAFYMFITTAPFFLLLYEAAVVQNKGLRFWITMCFALSSVMLFSYERGSTMILAALFSAFFILNYNNPNRVTREFSFLSLAMAAALKGVPAALGVLLIYEKRWWEALRLVAYGLFFIVGPFFLIKGGLNNIPQFLDNLSLNSLKYSIMPYRGLNYRFWSIELHLASKKVLGKVWAHVWLAGHYATIALALVSAFFQKKRWKQLSLLLFAVALFSENNGDYWALFLLIGIVLFLNEEEHPAIDGLYLLGFLLILNPFQLIGANGLNWTSVLRNLSCIACLLALTADSTKCMVRAFIGRRKERLNRAQANVAQDD